MCTGAQCSLKPKEAEGSSGSGVNSGFSPPGVDAGNQAQGRDKSNKCSWPSNRLFSFNLDHFRNIKLHKPSSLQQDTPFAPSLRTPLPPIFFLFFVFIGLSALTGSISASCHEGIVSLLSFSSSSLLMCRHPLEFFPETLYVWLFYLY